MLVSDSDPHVSPGPPDASIREPRAALEIPPQAAGYLRQLHDALALHAAGTAPGALETAFAAAGALLATVASVRPGERPDLAEMRRLADALPEFGSFLSCAADEAGQVVAAGTAALWRALDLTSPPPAWTPGEHEAARMLFACALAPFQDASPARLQTGLRSLAAARIAEALATALTAAEEPWASALGGRYASVRHRCAPRTTWRSRGLSDLLSVDPSSRQAVAARLEQWLIAGGDRAGLAGELEAALVHARTPARFA